MFKFLTPEELYDIFRDKVPDYRFSTFELKDQIKEAMNAAYTQGIKDATTLHKGEKT